MEPEELEDAHYVGFSANAPIEVGTNPTSRRRIVLPKKKGFGKTHFDIRLSGFGTWVIRHRSSRAFWVNNIQVDPGETVALHPAEGRPNQIRIGHYFISVLVVYKEPFSIKTIDEFILPKESNSEEVFTSRTFESLTVQSQNSSSSGTSAVEHLVDGFTNYYVLDSMPSDWSNTAFCGIRARPCHGSTTIVTGARYLVHQFEPRYHRNLALFYDEFATLPPHPHLASVIDIDQPAGLLVQEYYGFRSVQFLDAARACRVFRQVLSGLKERHARGISHGRIQPNFIIESLRSDAVQLDGYWYLRVMQDARAKATPFQPSRDLKDLAETVLQLLRRAADPDLALPGILSDLPSPMDPLLHSVIEIAKRPETRTDDLALYVERLTDDRDRDLISFAAIQVKVRLSYMQGRLRTNVAIPAFKTEDLASLCEKVIRSRPGRITSRDVKLVKLLKASDVQSYMSRSQLKKVMDHNQRLSILEILPERVDTPSGTIEVDVDARVSCLESCAMVNVTQLISLTGSGHYKSALRHAYEIRGIPGHTGSYAHVDHIESEPFGQDIRRSLHVARQSRSDALTRFSHDRHVFFATALQWCSVIVMKRDTFAVDWDPFSRSDCWLDIQSSYDRCDLFGLAVLRQAMEEFVDGGGDPSHVFGEELSVNAEGSTSDFLDNSDSDGDPLRFKRRPLKR